jgi:hypothetical protein
MRAGRNHLMLPLFSMHLLKKSRWAGPVPLELPAAGLPGTRGGNAFVVSAWHFFASSTVMAAAELVNGPVAKQINARRKVTLLLLNMADPPRWRFRI